MARDLDSIVPPKRVAHFAAYVVFKGREPGIYKSWEEAKKQVHAFSNCKHKGYSTHAKAKAAYKKWLREQRNIEPIDRSVQKSKLKSRKRISVETACDLPPWNND
ncbi:RNase H1/viroplasmin domain-containing protein [Alteromonas naphthalenivorans]|uniref:Ribonuclease H-related protein n=1 Tax=Alteromonas naphthalenivorans TaxID=715451 RepID=F5Z5F6_ALTNA|nr:RNase H1/viroplasmin domain-containing protein [Alteromonas naphthalenivorans]AEF04882.1 ribonuclease H-related protein [Alteromonas naphthalenivorans]